MSVQLTILPEISGSRAHMECADNLDFMRDLPAESIKLELTLTDEGDSGLDFYVGVGPSVIAALNYERSGYGCDIVHEYIDIVRQRVSDHPAGTPRTRRMGKLDSDPSFGNGGF